MAASDSFSIFIFEKNIKYVYTRNVLNKFQGTENIQKHSFRSILKDSFLKILKYSQEITMVEIVFIKNISAIAFLKLS